MNKLLSSKVLALSILALAVSESYGMQQAMQQNQNSGLYCKDIVGLLSLAFAVGESYGMQQAMQQNQNSGLYRKDIVGQLPSDKQGGFRTWFADGVKITTDEAAEFLDVLGFTKALNQHTSKSSVIIRDNSRKLAAWINANWDNIQEVRRSKNIAVWPGVAEYYKSLLFDLIGADFFGHLNTFIFNDSKVLSSGVKNINADICKGRSGQVGCKYIYKKLYESCGKIGVQNIKQILVQVCPKPNNNQQQGWSPADSIAWEWFASKGMTQCTRDQLRLFVEKATRLGEGQIYMERDAKRSFAAFIKFLDRNWVYLQPLMERVYAEQQQDT